MSWSSTVPSVAVVPADTSDTYVEAMGKLNSKTFTYLEWCKFYLIWWRKSLGPTSSLTSEERSLLRKVDARTHEEAVLLPDIRGDASRKVVENLVHIFQSDSWEGKADGYFAKTWMQ